MFVCTAVLFSYRCGQFLLSVWRYFAKCGQEYFLSILLCIELELQVCIIYLESCLYLTYVFVLQPKLSMAKCRRNVENFLDACRKIGVSEDKLCLPHHILEEKGLVKLSMTVQALVEQAAVGT